MSEGGFDFESPASRHIREEERRRCDSPIRRGEMRVGVGGIRPPRSKSDRFFSVVAVCGLLALAASAATAAEAAEEAVIKAEKEER